MKMRSLLLLFLITSCVVEVEADRPASTESPVASAPRAPRLVTLERLTGGAKPSERVPTVLAIHGLGDTPENFARIFDSLSVRARVIYPRAPLSHHGGFAWTKVRVRGGDERALEEDITLRVSELSQLLEQLARRPEIDPPFIVTGFSQGGILTYALTLAHPELVRAAFPIGGTLPRSARSSPPKAPPSAPRIVAFHGDADTVVPYAHDRALVEALRERGWAAELHTAEGVGHTISPELRRAVHQAIEASASE